MILRQIRQKQKPPAVTFFWGFDNPEKCTKQMSKYRHTVGI